VTSSSGCQVPDKSRVSRFVPTTDIKIVEFIIAAYHDNPDINLEVFVHKAEKMQDEDKSVRLTIPMELMLIYTHSGPVENFRQIHERISDRLLDVSPDYELNPLDLHLTSVYDHSLHEAFSRVLHKLIDSLPYLEELLNVFCAVRDFLSFAWSCQQQLMRKGHAHHRTHLLQSVLFDITSRLYVATDASPVDQQTHNLCCDYLQMLNSFGSLYRSVHLH